MDKERESKIKVEEINGNINLFGPSDIYLKEIEDHYNVNIVARNGDLIINGDNNEAVKNAEAVITDLYSLVKSKHELNIRDIIYTMQIHDNKSETNLVKLLSEEVGKTIKGKSIKVKSLGQKEYAEAIKNKDMVFGVGPAGTGKTFLAVVMAVTALRNNEVKKIILTRPAVEAGENLGFLPGDLQEKVNPYLRPLYDALIDMLGMETMQRLIEKGTIEIAPLAFMRGRTLSDAFVILDEAQNTTQEQMKMFLTRLGFGSKMVITGDITQIDLPKGTKSGLVEVIKLLEDIKEISIVHLTEIDVVRHQLVQKIIKAYQALDNQNGAN